MAFPVDNPTVNDMLTLCLTDAGVIGQGLAPLPEDSTNALARLNWMLAAWRRQRWIVYNLQNFSVIAQPGVGTVGKQIYTVGPGGDFDTGGTQRPDRIEYSFFRQIVPNGPTQQTDYPLEILTSWEDYNRIGIKKLGTFPTTCFYDNAFPLGNYYPWPIPQADLYELFITVKGQLAGSLNFTDDLTLPEEYFNAIHWNLTVILRSAYDLPPKPGDVAFAKESLNVLRGANAQIARLQLPGELLRPGIYNPYSDNYR
jgi:hypothetical protein